MFCSRYYITSGLEDIESDTMVVIVFAKEREGLDSPVVLSVINTLAVNTD
jgi:hypothetical protein